MKTLDAPILDRLFEPLGHMLTPEVARKLVNYRQGTGAHRQACPQVQRGQLSDEECREYETCVHAIDFIAILQAKARALLKRSTSDA